MTRQRRYEPLLVSQNITQLPQRHKFEVRRRENGFEIVTRHYSAGDAELQKRREGGEVVEK